MIIRDSGLESIQCELFELDEITAKLGFVRWQWEYSWATYDCKLEHSGGAPFFLRVQTRAVDGRLEQQDALLEVESVYVGQESFPHGLDYAAPVPEAVLQTIQHKLYELRKQLREETVAEVMNAECATVSAQATLAEAAEQMKQYNTGFVSVVEQNVFVGIVTERDLVVQGYARNQSGAATIEAVIVKDAVVASPDLAVGEAIHLMVSRQLRGIPVVDEGKLLGIVSLEHLAGRSRFEFALREVLGEPAVPVRRNSRGEAATG